MDRIVVRGSTVLDNEYCIWLQLLTAGEKPVWRAQRSRHAGGWVVVPTLSVPCCCWACMLQLNTIQWQAAVIGACLHAGVGEVVGTAAKGGDPPPGGTVPHGVWRRVFIPLAHLSRLEQLGANLGRLRSGRHPSFPFASPATGHNQLQLSQAPTTPHLILYYRLPPAYSMQGHPAGAQPDTGSRLGSRLLSTFSHHLREMASIAKSRRPFGGEGGGGEGGEGSGEGSGGGSRRGGGDGLTSHSHLHSYSLPHPRMELPEEPPAPEYHLPSPLLPEAHAYAHGGWVGGAALPRLRAVGGGRYGWDGCGWGG